MGAVDKLKTMRKAIFQPINDLQRETRSRFLEALDNGKLVLERRERCICGSDAITHLADQDRFGLPFGAYLCEDCGLVFTSPFMPRRSVGYYYQEFYHLLHFGSHATPGKILYSKGQGAKIFDHVKDRVGRKDITVLEVGCGTGSVIKEFCRAAVDAGFSTKCTGLEFSKEYVGCFEPEGLDIRLIEGDIDALGKSEGPFDLVIMSHVLEHFPDPEAELDAIKSVLKPNALLYIEVPGIFSLRYRYAYNCEFSRYLTGAHVFNFNLASLTGLLNRNGFRLLWGTEEVESVFTPGYQSVKAEYNAILIKEYLKDLETNHLFYASLDSANLKQRLGISDVKEAVEFVRQIQSSLPYRVLKKFVGALRKFGILK